MGIALVFLAVLIKSFMARYRDIRKISVRVFLSILIILFFYRCFTNVVPDMYTYFRDDYGKMENMPAWHTLYVGLGWDEINMALHGMMHAEPKLLKRLIPM